MERRNLAILIAILALSFLLRVIAANYEWVDVDEGNYLYDAKLLLNGEVPLQDFYMKEIMYTSILALQARTFGISFYGARMMSVIFSLVTILFVYKIGNVLYGSRIGLIAALVYAAMPFTIFWNSLIRESVMLIMLLTISVYYLLKFLKTERTVLFFWHALFLMMSFLTRRSVALFLIFEAILMVYIYRGRTRLLAKNALVGLVGAMLPVLFVLIYSYATGANFLGLMGFEFSPYKAAFSWEQFLGHRALFPYWFFREAAYIGIPLAIVLTAGLKNKMKYTVLGIFFGLTALSAFSFEYLAISMPERMSQYPMPGIEFFAFSLAYLLALFCAAYYAVKSYKQHVKNDKVLLLWVFSISIFYLFYSRFHVVYFAEIMPAAAVIVSPFFDNLISDRTRMNRLFLVLLVFGVAMSSIFYIQYHGLNNKWSVQEAYEISDYIKANSNVEEEIFTPLTLIPILAERDIALNITHPLHYHFEGVVENGMVGAPPVRDVVEYLENNKVKYVIADDYMDVTYYSLRSDIKDHVDKNYVLNKKIGDVEILVRR